MNSAIPFTENTTREWHSYAGAPVCQIRGLFLAEGGEGSRGPYAPLPLRKPAPEVSTRDEVMRAKLNVALEKASSRFHETLDEAVELGLIPPLDAAPTAQAMLAFLEGVILLAKTRNDPEVARAPGPAIKTLRIELADGN
jgi:AcrR family transcriptional regulator